MTAPNGLDASNQAVLPPLAAAQTPMPAQATAASSAQANPLEQLKDIHLPDAISWWPPAPGWWLLAVVIIVTVTATTVFIWQYWKKNAYRRQALTTLKTLQQKQLDQAATITALATLLRQTAIAAKLANAQSINGKEWADILQQHMPDDVAQLLALSRYQKQPDCQLDDSALYRGVQTWIKKHKAGAAANAF